MTNPELQASDRARAAAYKISGLDYGGWNIPGVESRDGEAIESHLASIIETTCHLKELEAVADAAREYTTERSYQNVEACRKDQDRLEQILLDSLATLDAAKEGE